MKWIYATLFGLLNIIAKLPFGFLYAVSDILFVLIFYLVGYRKKVVFENLTNSFPDKSKEEIQEIAKKFYAHFCDLLVESIKTSAMTFEDFQRRITVKNTELLNQLYEEGKSVVMYCAHYGNWEWVLFIPQMLKHIVLPVYHPLKNPYSDAYFVKLRGKFGGIPTQMSDTLRTLVAYKQKHIPTIIWLAADQSPAVEGAYWTEFLYQDTPFYMGPEKIAKKLQQAVVFMYINKVGRGKYEMGFELMEKDPQSIPNGAITQKYVSILEKTIRELPEYWLWSHKRWKHTRETDN
ncbi:MAG: lysophospholipid acyltransferase family protein [Thermoflexibacter sp.]|jgi:KDO2-lipid IV(A) lauroyltransferase|nr:lysophospholipid acyltransferase family protein [Thermoflexibacter sp.]